MTDKIRLAILGCGAITRDSHLPAAVAIPGIRVAALVDSDFKRADTLRRSFGLDCKVTTDYQTILNEVDGIINALPNHLHVPVTLDAFRAGRHVLCEKPLALTETDARTLCEAAQNKGLLLAVGMHMRFHPNHRVLRLAMDEGMLGAIEGYDWEHGGAWDWDTKSGFYFSRTQAGGGILIDFGPHLLDRVIDWFGPVEQFDYQDDNWGGGIEANVLLRLTHSGRYGKVSGRLRLSRTYLVKNLLLVQGTQSTAELRLNGVDSVTLHRLIGGHDVSMALRLSDLPESRPNQCYFDQLNNFAESIRGTQKPLVDGWQAMETIKLIEGCYAKAKRIPEPWAEVHGAPIGVNA